MSADCIVIDPYVIDLSKLLQKDIPNFHSFKFIEEFDQTFCFEFRFNDVNVHNFGAIAIGTNFWIDNFNKLEDKKIKIVKSKGRLGTKLYVRMFIQMKCVHKKGE